MSGPTAAARELPPIDREEFILRRIHVNHYNAARPIPIDPSSFRPSPQDHDGLSFFREQFISPLKVAQSARQPAASYVVARFRAGDLFDLGLTLIPTARDDDPPGHVVAPELSTSGYEAHKSRCKETHKRLADLGSRDVVQGFDGF